MSAAKEWDFTVPDDDARLLADLRRHGYVRGGACMWLSGQDRDSVAAAPGLAECSREILQAEFPRGR